MKFKVQKRNKGHLKERHRHEELLLTEKFRDALLKKYKERVKSIVLGRTREELSEHLVNVYVILDDLSYQMDKQFIDKYVEEVHKIIKKISERIQVHTLKLSKHWDGIMEMDSKQVASLRDGYAVYDVGFYEPMQQLLFQGRVKPSYESLGVYFIRAPETWKRARGHVKQAVLDLYWAVMDAAQAALMKQGELSPSPAHVANLLDNVFVHKNLLEKKYVLTVDKLYHMAKQIEHEEILVIKGSEYDSHYQEAVSFVKRMRKLMEV